MKKFIAQHKRTMLLGVLIVIVALLFIERPQTQLIGQSQVFSTDSTESVILKPDPFYMLESQKPDAITDSTKSDN